MKVKKLLSILAALALSAVPVAALADDLVYDDGTYEAALVLGATVAPAVQFDATGTGVYALDSVSFALSADVAGTYPVAVQVWDDALASVQTVSWDVAVDGSALYTLDLADAKIAFTGSTRVGIFLRDDPALPAPGVLSLGLDTVSTLPFGHSFVFDALAVPPADPWAADALANYGIRASVRLVPALACEGFLAPFNRTVTMKKGGRTLPLKVFLFDDAGAPVTRAAVDAAPLVQLFFVPGPGVAPVEVTDFVVPAGRSNQGQAFRSADAGKWIYNLKTKKALPAGTYTVQVGSGDGTAYVVAPTCTGTFVIDAPKPKKHMPKGGKK
jgi:hypothetical protein